MTKFNRGRQRAFSIPAHVTDLSRIGIENRLHAIEFTKSRIPLNINSGELAGLFAMRDSEIPALRRNVSELVTAFTNRVNVLHMQGYGLDGNKGRTFFADTEHRRLAGTIPLPGDGL